MAADSAPSDQRVSLGAQRGDGEGHGNAVIAAGVDGRAVQ